MRVRTVIAVLLLMLAIPASADYKQSYRDGRKAMDRGNWAEAEKAMRQAAAENPKEGEDLLIYGNRFERYVPHYFIGYLAARRGDCAAAMTAFNESERQGAILKSSFAKEFRQLRDDCRSKVPAPQPAQPPPTPAPTTTTPETPAPTPAVDTARINELSARAEQQLDRAAAAQRRLEQARRDQLAGQAWGQNPALARRESSAASLIQDAREKLAEGRKSSSTGMLEEAANTAGRAAAELDAIGDELGRARQTLVTQQQRQQQPPPPPAAGGESAAALAQLRTEITEAQRLLGEFPASAPLSPAIKRQRGALESQLEQASTLSQASSAEELKNATARLASARASFLDQLQKAPAGSGPPPWLFQAASSYLGGDYARTVQLLQTIDPTSSAKARAQALLFRSAARFNLYYMSPRPDAGVLQQARDDAEQVKTLNPSLEPLQRAFSPRFIRFFQNPDQYATAAAQGSAAQ